MDFAKYDTKKGSEQGAWCHLRAPKEDNEPGDLLYENDDPTKPVRIFVLGPDSKRAQKIVHEIQRVARKDRDDTPEEQQERQAEWLHQITLRWENVGLPGEDNTEFSSDAAHQLYLALPDISQQVAKFFGDRSNFTPKAMKNGSLPSHGNSSLQPPDKQPAPETKQRSSTDGTTQESEG